MTTAVTVRPAGPSGTEPSRRRAAALLALRLYLRELARDKLLSGGALVLPALGNIGAGYVPPLIIGALVGAVAAGTPMTVAFAMPYVLGFGGSLLVSEGLWRGGIHCLNRADARGIERRGARPRRRGAGGRRAPAPGGREPQADAALVGLRQPAHRHALLAPMSVVTSVAGLTSRVATSSWAGRTSQRSRRSTCAVSSATSRRTR